MAGRPLFTARNIGILSFLSIGSFLAFYKTQQAARLRQDRQNGNFSVETGRSGGGV
ncbi:MAG: hypothetical protein M1828_002404 [Chrysothrix sp. TS-e1954]|nr:MAG: hypothetical protein M1828_002404 [Chrysothrix sp. TS-e1954]